MKKTLSILILGVLPAIALAHEAGHGMQGPPDELVEHTEMMRKMPSMKGQIVVNP